MKSVLFYLLYNINNYKQPYSSRLKCKVTCSLTAFIY